MRKKLLSIFFVMFLMLLLSPETAQASEISYVAQIGGNNYNTLEDAIAAVPEGNTIKLLEDIILVDTVEITRSVHFQLNLNGKKLYGEGIEGSAINLQSNKELWIYDNSVDGGGTITGTIEVGTSEITYCNLKLEDVTVQSNSNTTILIQRGIVEVTNSSVINTSNNSAIHNFAGRVIVRSGTVKNTSDGRAINNLGGRVDVEGGSVEANTGTAIYNLDTGTIFISGSALITSANTNINEGTIFQQNQPGLTAYNTFLYICGGTIANTAETGTAIYNASAGTIKMQDITTGSVVISGGGVAMNKAPYLAGYTVKISASATNTNGTGASAIRRMVIADNITSYKYLKFEKAPYAAQIGATCYPTLQAAFDAAFAAVETNQTINLLEDIYLIGPVTIAEGISKSFTLNLNGKTLSSYQSSIRHLGNGTLIITDTGGGGIITTDDISGYQVPIYIKGGNLAISGGTVDGVIGDTIRNEGTGTVSVSGGTVRNNKQYAISSTAGGKITISGSATVTSASHETANRSTISQTGGTSPEAVVLEITGGTIENTSEFGRAICVRGSGIISISGGQVIADKGAAVWTLNTEKVFISGTATLKNKSTYSGNGTLRMENQIGNASTLEITGGTIENQDGQAIYIYANCNVDIVIPSGRSIIRGGSNAVSKAPNFSSYTDVQVKACTDYDGGTEAAYDSKNIDSYKYLAFTPRTATTVSNLSLNDKLPAPVTGDTPATTYINDAQYTGTYTWPEVTGSKFIGSRSYTATVTLTAAEGYTFSGLEANSFEFTDAVVTHDKGIGNILIVNIKFPYTAPRTLESIEISNQPIKTVYKYGETFSKEGMIVKAFYNDDTIGENYTQYKWDKAFPLVMDDTTVTITDKVITSISATLNITVIKADGPAAPTGLAGVAPTTLGGADGKITGTTALMEYDYLISFTGPADCTETETTGLPAGNYYVRMKATTTHEAGAYWIVIVPAGVTTIAIPTPNSGLSWNNSEQTGVNSGTGYTLSGTDKATAVGSYTAIATLQPGYIWNDSTTTEKTISWSIAKADGPIVPTDLVGVAPTTFGGTDGKITGTTTLMEYADNTEFTSAIECSSTEITGLLAGTYYVRIKSTDTHEASAYATVNVLAGVTTIAIPTPNSGLKWNNNEQPGVNSGTGYTLSGTDKARAVGNYTATATLQPGYVWTDSTTTEKTISWSIAKADGPAAPAGLTGVAPTTLGGTDGKITGTTTLMEYADNTEFTSAIECSSIEITGLLAGTYYVRIKSTDTHEASAYSTVNVLAGVTTIAVPTPNSGLKWNDSEQTGVNSGTGYTLSGTDKARAVGNYTATATLQPGYAWNDSTTTKKTISWSIAKADGPIAPIDLVGIAPTNLGGTDGKITGTTTLMEYADNTEFTGAIECSSSEITGLLAGTYYVRIKSTDTHEAGAYATVNVLVGVTTIAIPMPNSGLKWNNSEQTGVNSGTGYTLSGTDKARAVGNYTATATLQPGYVWNDSTTTEKTISWSIEKADGPAINGVSAVGCTTPDNNDGKLIGMTTAMEYKKIGDASYTAVSGSAISVSGSAIIGLTNSDYLVRFAETETHNAGPDSTFTVASFIPAPTYTISGYIKGSDTNSGIAGACVQLKSGSGNIGSSVFTDSSGAYTISGVSTGTYSIEVSANGYDIDTISSFNLSDANITGKNLTLIKTVILIPVTDIIMNNSASVQVGTNLTLTGIITPTNATNRTITWSVENENGTGAIITGNTFRATSAGTVTVKVTVINGSSTSSDYNKTFTITVTSAPTPSPTPSPIPIPTPSPTEKPEGTVETDKQQDDGVPTVNLNNSNDELKTRVLTLGEQDMVTRGENAKIILKVTDISASVTDEEKKLIHERLALENGAVENGASDISILYVDLSLYKQVGSQEQIKVTQTKGKISISIDVPEALWNTDITKNRDFYTIRIHDGEVTRIDGSYDADKHIFTFETDRFSTYALTYQDSSRIQTYDDFRQLHLKAKADKTSITLSYKRVINVDGYLIYGGKCGEEMTKLAEVPAKTISYTVKSLKPGTYYKYQVKAYRIIDGEQVIIMTSKVVHSITESKTYSNPTKVTSDSTTVRLEAGEAKTVTCQVVLPKGKKLKEHTTAIRYESSNKAIATVNSKGTITAKEKGSCYVYAYAQNGVYKRIKVTVK